MKLAWLNGGEKDAETNAPVAPAFVPMGEDATDEAKRIPIGSVPLMPCLGVSALPYAPDDKGHAEAVIAENVGGLPGVCVAAWDTRAHVMCANLKPGDTVLHSTGPNLAAQVQLKEDKRQVVLATTKADKKQMLLVLDGKNEKFQIAVNGAMIQIDKSGTIDMSSANGQNGITIGNDGIWLRGALILGGMTPNPALKIALCPPTGSPGGPASVPLIAAPGVSIGF